jgi:metal-sulfur cluster biosynthetic enzyme
VIAVSAIHNTAIQTSAREAEVWARLDGVMDPELDESVTELNFISSLAVDAQNRVHIGFRLPTYWCASNFSFLMADDMRRAASDLSWVEEVHVVLGEHMDAEKINAGLARGLSFQDTFGDEADGDLDDLRQTFLLKAFQRRQAALLSHLTGAGFAAEEFVALSLAGLSALPLDAEGGKLLQRYLERRHVAGPSAPDDLAFVDAEGEPLMAETFAVYVRALRRVGVNAEFNGALCRGLLAVRFDLDTPLATRSPLADISAMPP